MQLTKIHKIIISAVVVLILLGIYIVIDKKSLKAPSEETEVNSQVSTTTPTGSAVISGKGYTIEQVPITEGKTPTMQMPSLDRPITVSAGAIVAPEARAYAEEKIKSLQTRLKANNKDVNAWIDLAMHQKNAGDYDGAVLSLKYASYLAPTDYTSLGNLANLYAYFIHDNAQAEIYYKKAIEKGPFSIYLYEQLAEVYRDIFKDLDKARATVNAGLAKVPNDPLLLQLQASLK